MRKRVSQSSKAVEALSNMLLPLGFDREDLKTTNFSIDTEYESYQDHGTYKQRFAGYKYTHILKLEFEENTTLLGKALYNIATCGVNPELRIIYTVKDQEAAKNELLWKAVEDAKTKAKVLSQAVGVILKEIQTIDYSWGEVRFDLEPVDGAISRCEPLSAESYKLDIEPDGIDASDTVTVVWEIE